LCVFARTWAPNVNFHKCRASHIWAHSTIFFWKSIGENYKKDTLPVYFTKRFRRTIQRSAEKEERSFGVFYSFFSCSLHSLSSFPCWRGERVGEPKLYLKKDHMDQTQEKRKMGERKNLLRNVIFGLRNMPFYFCVRAKGDHFGKVIYWFKALDPFFVLSLFAPLYSSINIDTWIPTYIFLSHRPTTKRQGFLLVSSIYTCSRVTTFYLCSPWKVLNMFGYWVEACGLAYLISFPFSFSHFRLQLQIWKQHTWNILYEFAYLTFTHLLPNIGEDSYLS